MNSHPGAAGPSGVLPPETAPFMHLAGICSLTPILSELPTPSPSRNVTDAMLSCLPKQENVLQETLKITEESPSEEDQILLRVVTQALARNSNMDAIALKEPYCRYPEQIDPSSCPPLVQAIMRLAPNVFSPRHILNDANIANGPNPVQPASPDDSALGNNSLNDLSQLAPPSNSSVGSAEPSTPGSESERPTHVPRQDAQLRRQIVSVGKQPKAAISNRKKKDIVSELFDSLTPDPQYFADTHRRRRKQPSTYNDENFDKPSISSLAPDSPKEDLGLPPPPPRIASPTFSAVSSDKPCTSEKTPKAKKRKRRASSGVPWERK